MLPKKGVFLGLSALLVMLSLSLVGARVNGELESFTSVGVVQGTEVKIGFEVPGRIASLSVDEGAAIQAGQVLGNLEGALLGNQLRQAELNLNVAKNKWAQALAEYESNKVMAEYQVKLARANEQVASIQNVKDPALAEAQYRTAMANLKIARERADSQPDGASASVLEAQVEVASSTADAARIQWEKSQLLTVVQADQALHNRAIAQARLDLLVSTFPSQQRFLEDQVALAEVGVNTAKEQVAKLNLIAPINGTVAHVLSHQGEVVGAGQPVIIVRSTDELTVKVYVTEEYLFRIKVGQKTSVTSPALPGRTFVGTVTSIGAAPEFTPKNVTTASDIKANVYPVMVRLTTAASDWKAGMSATVQFLN